MLILHPHDAFVRNFLGDIHQARDFFRLTLPPPFQATFNLDTLRPEPTSLIDETLSEQQSDLLFSLLTPDGDPQLLYLLFEHKSYADPHLPLQLLGYLSRIYARQPEPAPILPFVFHHGERPLFGPLRRFPDRFPLSDAHRALVQPYLPDFAYLLCDLSVWQPPVEPTLAVQVFLEALRSARSGDSDRTRHLLELAARLLNERNGARIVHAVLSYLYHVTPWSRTRSTTCSRNSALIWRTPCSPPPSNSTNAVAAKANSKANSRAKPNCCADNWNTALVHCPSDYVSG
ncbi:MAG: Rpn family recombination-promoting nuclease/putative transposase [Candidatus Competibacteraceae bacterium]